MLVMFLIGLVPTLLFHHAVRWRLRNRLVIADRTITELRTAAMAPTAPPPAAEPDETPAGTA
jgi:hypothetical protein